MDNAKIEAALKLIDEQVAAIREELGGGQVAENPMVAPEKPAGSAPGAGGGMREFLGMR